MSRLCFAILHLCGWYNVTHHLHVACTSTIYVYAPTRLLVLAQWGNTALLRAAYGGSVSVVRALLEDYGSSVDEVNEVSHSSNVRCYLVTKSGVFSCMFCTALNAHVHL